jgi:hypothetical protein
VIDRERVEPIVAARERISGVELDDLHGVREAAEDPPERGE